ncbi:asporin [Sarcophilus harrisii]|uniref:Asporin n=1 Tax=Sarcophilus harrisii TaxID=9305 RepID=A0A7N4V4Q8_SARHA|nr:asporin [Sarcophilus harrisii]XP_031807404.1 asporin [Sarcophilus harrisii]XP_031807409.1 asporin [Sarcophilus harrisii]
MKEYVLLLLLALGSAKPFSSPSYLTLKNMMLKDMEDADDDDDDDDDDENSLFPTRQPIMPFFPFDLFPSCPFGCQCYSRVVHCSDLGLTSIPNNIPFDTRLIDLQNNKIKEIKENDFKGLTSLYGLMLNNNKLTKIHPKAFLPVKKLRRLYLSHNLLTEIPINLPKSLAELRIHDNKVKKIQKETFKGMNALHVLEMSANPLENDGIDPAAFEGVTVFHIRIADAKLTSVPKGLPSSLLELHLDDNKISTVELEDFKRYKDLQRLGLGNNKIKDIENGSLANIPHVREIHLEKNKLKKVPPGLQDLKYLQVIFLHHNNITRVGVNDFCPTVTKKKKSLYSAISLFNNPVKYWELQPATFRCVLSRMSVQLGNFRK